jgi:valyl-tRNA synthetase
VNGLTREVNRALEEFRYDEAAGALYHFLWHQFCDWYIEAVKPHLVGERSDSSEAARSRAILVKVLDRILRLLHPFMPFLTEELWQRIPHEGPSVAVAGFPEWREDEHDEEAEKDMALLILVVTKLRNLRAENNIDPGRRVQALFRTDHELSRRVLEENAMLIQTLARLAGSEFVEEIPSDTPAARAVITGLEMAIPLLGALDLEEERQRLSRELEKVDRELETTLGKLENPSFANRAPAAVVEKVRSAHRELLDRKAKLTETLAVLPASGSPPPVR